MGRSVNLLAGTRDGPTAIDGFHSSHHPGEIWGDGQITANQLLQGSQAVGCVIDRTQLVVLQQFGQLPGVHTVILFAFLQQGIPTRIADHQFCDVWFQQVVQPGSPGSFLKRDVHVTFEEGTWAAWLYDLLKPHVTKLVVCDPRRNALLQEGKQNDRVDARKLAELLQNNQLRPVYHAAHRLRTL